MRLLLFSNDNAHSAVESRLFWLADDSIPELSALQSHSAELCSTALLLLPEPALLSTRKWTFRAVAMLLGLSAFILLEAVCRINGWGAAAPSTGDFAEFAAVRPLFQRDEATSEYHVAANRRRYFSEESFSASKPANEFRIFVFGGSTVQGRPFSIATSFTTFLEMSLNKACPSTRWQVVNCGGISYASYRLLPVMKECLTYQPDLYIVCTGHNEFLEFISYSSTRQSRALTSSYSMLDRFNSFHVAQSLLSAAAKPKAGPETIVPRMAEEVDAVLDHQGGLMAYTRETLHAEQIVDNFAANLQQMVDLSAAAGVPLMMMQPPSNLRDCPPFKSEYSRQTTAEVQSDISAKLKLASELHKTDPSTAIRTLSSITTADPEFALGWYQLGRALAHNHQPQKALDAFTHARDEDICPLRMTSDLQQAMADVVVANNVPFLDVQKLLVANSRDGLVGEAALVDHIHPSFRSHLEIGVGITQLMHAHGLVQYSDEGWATDVREHLEDHLQSLDNMYFLRGRQTLELLQIWTDGRADGPPLTVSDSRLDN